MTEEVVAQYEYKNADGELVYTINRTNYKKFFPTLPDGGTHLDGIERVLYKLPEILQAASKHEIVWVCESEKSVDRMTELGLVATCSSGGANWEWPREFGAAFTGCERVYVLPDNDKPGMEAAKQRARVISMFVRDTRIVELDNLQPKQDVFDYLEFFDVDDLWKRGEYAPLFQFIPKKIEINVEQSIIGFLIQSKAGTTDVLRQIHEQDFADPFYAAAFHAIQAIVGVGLKPDVRSVSVKMLRNKYPLKQEQVEERLWELYDNKDFTSDAIQTWVDAFVDAAAARSVEVAVSNVLARLRDGEDGATLISAWENAGVTIRRSVGAVEEAPNVSEILKTNVSHNWLLPNFMERKDRMIIVGAEGSGKAVFLRQMAVKAAAGIDMWDDSVRRTPIRVLIIDRENSIPQTARDLKRPVETANKIVGLNWHDNLKLQVSPSAINLLNPNDRQWMESQIITNRPDLIFCMPIYKMYEEDGKQGSEKNAQQFIKIIDEFRERYDCSFVFEAHAPLGTNDKNRVMRPNGSSVWLRWPELGWGFATMDRPHCYKVIPFRGNRNDNIYIPEIVFWNKQPAGWRWLHGEDV